MHGTLSTPYALSAQLCSQDDAQEDPATWGEAMVPHQRFSDHASQRLAAWVTYNGMPSRDTSGNLGLLGLLCLGEHDVQGLSQSGGESMGLMGLMGLVGPCSFGASNLIPSLRRFGWTPFSGKVRRRCLDRAARECLRAALAAFDSRT